MENKSLEKPGGLLRDSSKVVLKQNKQKAIGNRQKILTKN